MSESSDIAIRPARSEDCALLLRLITELARYERLQAEMTATEEGIRSALFSPRPVAEALLAECDSRPAGFALFFPNFSTFVGRPGLYLEDLYVREEFRGRGIGKSLLRELIAIADRRGCGRMDWAVLDWNRPAIEFYEAMGARVMRQWLPVRLDRQAIEKAARAGRG